MASPNFLFQMIFLEGLLEGQILDYVVYLIAWISSMGLNLAVTRKCSDISFMWLFNIYITNISAIIFRTRLGRLPPLSFLAHRYIFSHSSCATMPLFWNQTLSPVSPSFCLWTSPYLTISTPKQSSSSSGTRQSTKALDSSKLSSHLSCILYTFIKSTYASLIRPFLAQSHTPVQKYQWLYQRNFLKMAFFSHLLSRIHILSEETISTFQLPPF